MATFISLRTTCGFLFFWLDAAIHAAQRRQSITHMLDMFLVLQANRAVGPWMTSCGRVVSASIGWRG